MVDWRAKSKSGYRTISLIEEVIRILIKQKEKNEKIKDIPTEFSGYIFRCRKGAPVKNSTDNRDLF